MRLIDADNVIFELNRMLNIVDERNARPDQKEEFKTIRTYVEWTKEVIHDTPTIDAVEVVRCKDCKYSKHLKQYPKVNTWKCTLTDVVYRADDFCSYGERREEE